jgi:RNA-splicing ligase RtcB
MPIAQEISTGRVPIKVWTPELEGAARKQLENVASLPIIHGHVAAMPDVHAGIGATVGSVIPTKGAVIPAAVGVDIGCFTGDTEVVLVDSKSHRLEELARRGGHIYIYACTPDGHIERARATARMTRRDAALVEVELDNGKRVRCTPDHRFMLRDGTYQEAAQLLPGVSLMPFHYDLEKHRLEREVALNNHKAIAVRELPEREDVYCLTVPGLENFALAAGVFVHNCGMHAVRLSLTASDLPTSLKPLRHAIEEVVPLGFDTHRDMRDPQRAAAAKSMEEGLHRIVERHPKLTTMQKSFDDTWLKQLGTLGGGNHFIEVCLDEEQHVWVMVHSGSRGIGNVIGRYFIEKARRRMEKGDVHLPDRDLAWLAEGTPEFDDYVEAVHWAQDYAMENRRQMLHAVIEVLREHLPPFKLVDRAIECHHNYVSRERHFGADVLVTRKGAIRAGAGEMGIIPGSMGARSFIVRGKGNAQSLCSCAHGAGRRMSRGEAKRRFSAADLAQQTEGIECRKDEGVVDEIPGAYKSIDEVMAHQSDLVDVVPTLKQVVCVKG